MYTLSADQETLTATDADRTPWYDMGSGASLARTQWDGTASGTIQMRSSATRPDRTDDSALTMPAAAEFDFYYDADLGTEPDSQGFTRFAGGGTDTVSGGWNNVVTAGNFLYYGSASPGFTAADHTAIIWSLRPEVGHVGQQQLNLTLPHAITNNYIVLVFGGSSHSWKVRNYNTSDDFEGLTMVAGTAYHFRLDCFAASGTLTSVTLSYRLAGSKSLDDSTGWISMGEVARGNSAGQNIYWGNALSGTTNVSWGDLWVYNGGQWETVTDGDTSFAAGSGQRRYVQVKGWESGTITGVDLASDLAAPGNPSGPEAGAIGASAIGGNCTTEATGAAAYWVELLDADAGDAVVQDGWSDDYEPKKAFRGLTAGNYKMRFASASDDGVRGSAAVTTASMPVPAVAPSVALVLSDTTVETGETATITATLTGGATATLDGGALSDGVPANAVTGVAGVQNPPTIGPDPRWVSGELRFYKPTVGTNTLTGGTYAILSATQAAGAYTVADSNSWASITWRATDGTGEYVTATDLGLSVSSTAWYRDRITDSANLVAEGQTAAYGGDTANAYCAVTFSGLTAGDTVACRLSDAVEVGGVTYPAGPYSATVDGSGNASLSVPRCDAGTGSNSDGVPFGYFTGGSPTAFVLDRRIPDAATATFASLVSP
jgi:hypothetical protein